MKIDAVLVFSYNDRTESMGVSRYSRLKIRGLFFSLMNQLDQGISARKSSFLCPGYLA